MTIEKILDIIGEILNPIGGVLLIIFVVLCFFAAIFMLAFPSGTRPGEGAGEKP